VANIKSAKKRIRVNERQHEANLVHKGRARTAVKKARLEIAAGNVDEAKEAVREAQKLLDKAAAKGVIHANNASRRKARLMAHLAALESGK